MVKSSEIRGPCSRCPNFRMNWSDDWSRESCRNTQLLEQHETKTGREQLLETVIDWFADDFAVTAVSRDRLSIPLQDSAR